MATRELFPGEVETRYVTFALSGTCTNDRHWRRRRWERRERTQFLQQNGACLLFGTGDVHPVKVMSSVAKTSFVHELFGPTFWFTGYRDKVVVAYGVVGERNRENPPISFGFVQCGKLFCWPETQIVHTCMKLESFVGCYACPSEDSFGACVEENAKKLLAQDGVSGPFPEDGDGADVLTDDEDIEYFLQTRAPKAGWTYIKPGLFSGPYETKLSFAPEINMGDARCNLEAARDRWELGKKTIAAKKICKEKCYLADWCSALEKPYFSAPTRCQEEGSHSEHGPYQEDEIREVFRLFREEINARPQEEIVQVAGNSGVSTYIFGYELQLCKMAPNLRDVEFVRPFSMLRETYSYEDAMTLLHTPYRYRDCDKVIRYGKPEMLRVEVRMSETELDIYTQLCQYTEAKTYCTRYPGRFACPLIKTVRWRPELDFYMTLKPGWDTQVHHLAQIGPIVGNWKVVPGVVSDNWELLRDVREPAGQDSS